MVGHTVPGMTSRGASIHVIRAGVWQPQANWICWKYCGRLWKNTENHRISTILGFLLHSLPCMTGKEFQFTLSLSDSNCHSPLPHSSSQKGNRSSQDHGIHFNLRLTCFYQQRLLFCTRVFMQLLIKAMCPHSQLKNWCASAWFQLGCLNMESLGSIFYAKMNKKLSTSQKLLSSFLGKMHTHPFGIQRIKYAAQRCRKSLSWESQQDFFCSL